MDTAEVQNAMMDLFGIKMSTAVVRISVLVVTVIVALAVNHVLRKMLRGLFNRSNVPSASIFINIVRGCVWAFALLLILKPVFGVEPTAFVAALGVTSVAISLGLQNTFSNLFGGFTLMVGKVLEPGDVISVGGVTGEVIDVNWRSTNVRLFNGDTEIIPNSVLSSTTLTKLAPFQAGEFPLPVMLSKDANLDEVRAEVQTIAQEALGEFYDEEFGVPIFIQEYTNFGIVASISLHTKPGISPGRARTAVGNAIAGKSWLA